MKQRTALIYLLFVLLVSPLFWGARHVFAQTGLPSIIDMSGSGFSSMWFELSPQNPGPNEMVQVKFVSYSGNLDTAEFAWFLNGHTFDVGIGLNKINVQTGESGKPLEISVIVKFVEGLTLNHSITVTPGRVAILWEADSYTPPFYKGKALHAVGQDITLIALPTITVGGEEVSPSNLLYEWYVGPNKLPGSGVGKQRVYIPADSMRVYKNARVVVSTIDRKSSSEARIEIPSTFPRLKLYEVNSLYGRIYEKALTGQLFSGTGEFSVIAEPYFFDRPRVNGGAVSVNWNLNNSTSTPRGFIQTFSPLPGASGTANLSVGARDSSNIFMQSNANISISYGNAKRSFF